MAGRGLAVMAVAMLAVGACSVAAVAPSPTTSTPSGTVTATNGSAQSSTDPAASTAASTSPSADASPRAPSCAEQVLSRLSPERRIGQLLMVGAAGSRGAGSLEATIRDHQVGGVVYLGGWRDSAKVAAASARLQGQATQGVALLVAADQEGGRVQQLRGRGFPALPTAVQQGRLSATELTSLWHEAGTTLETAGVNVNLAPVADTVPSVSASANAPIGRHSRQLGSDPAQVAGAVTAVIAGLSASGVIATVKHFPGLGRVTGNTDVTSKGNSDDVATASDPYLEPFRAGIAAGAGLVMVSSARYPSIDPVNQAVFSPVVVTGILRQSLGFAGVVVTDDVGVAVAVAHIPVGERATRFLAAGGDMVLTANPATVPQMVAAIRSRAAADPVFADQVHASVLRVLRLKERMGLLRCG